MKNRKIFQDIYWTNLGSVPEPVTEPYGSSYAKVIWLLCTPAIHCFKSIIHNSLIRYQNGVVGYTESYQNGGYQNGGYRNGGYPHGASYQNGGFQNGGFQNGGYHDYEESGRDGYPLASPSSRINGSLAITKLTGHDSANLKR
jgi:uncharacterized membrane protein YgcG